MSDSWKITLPCNRAEAEELGADNLFLSSSDSVPTLVARESDGGSPDDWLIEIYADEKPDKAMLAAVAKLAPSSRAKPQVEKLADQDWVTLSQQGLEPIRAGRFYVHTSNDAPNPDPGVRNFCIDASRAFGTGHHETTLGCLRALDRLKRGGRHFRTIADIGTGTGILAFASRHLWPTARIIASDIDPVSIEVTRDNAVTNGLRTGIGRDAIQLALSNGLDSAAIQRRAPFDLIVANILAGPLIALASQMAIATLPGSRLVLAGLMREQQRAVVSAFTHAGFRLRHASVENEWPCLVMIRTRDWRKRRPMRVRSSLAPDNFGDW